MSNLDKLRDRLASEYAFENTHIVYEHWHEKGPCPTKLKAFRAGFDAALSALSEQAERERDESERNKRNEYERWKETHRELTKLQEHHLDCHKIWKEKLAAAEAENKKLKEAIESQAARWG